MVGYGWQNDKDTNVLNKRRRRAMTAIELMHELMMHIETGGMNDEVVIGAFDGRDWGEWLINDISTPISGKFILWIDNEVDHDE